MVSAQSIRASIRPGCTSLRKSLYEVSWIVSPRGQDLEPTGQRDSIGEERLALKDLVDQSLRTTCEVTVSERTLHAVSTK